MILQNLALWKNLLQSRFLINNLSLATQKSQLDVELSSVANKVFFGIGTSALIYLFGLTFTDKLFLLPSLDLCT